MEQLFEKYENIQLFLEKYRKYYLLNSYEKFYNYNDFKNKWFKILNKKQQEKCKKNRENKITLHSTKSICTSLNNNKKQQQVILTTQMLILILRDH